MRIGWVIVGAVIAVTGVALLYVPVIPQASRTLTASPGAPAYFIASAPGASLTGKIPVSVSWTASTTVTVIGGACTSNCSNFSNLSDIVLQTGTSGTFTVDQPVGGSIFMGANTSDSSTGSVTFKATTAYTTVGSLLVIIGILILVAGLLLRRSRAGPAIATVPAPTVPSPTAAPATPTNPTD